MLGRINLVVGIVGLFGVYGLEYFFGFTPCDLCIKQRILAGLLICVSLFTLIAERFNTKISFFGDILITLTICAMFGLAIFQVGVEHKFFKLPETCSQGINENQTIDDLRKVLLGSESLRPSCDVPQILFGLSVATWSLFGTFGLFSIAILSWFLRFNKNALDNLKRKTGYFTTK